MAKVRIYQLAKELGMETQELLELLDQMGVAYKSHASTLEEKDAEAVREEADLLLSLSPLTLQHELALLVLMEQLYRVLTLRAGHPYHRP